MSFNIIVFAYLSLFALGFSDNSRGPLFSQIIDFFHLSNSEAAWMFAMTSITGVIGSMICPSLFRRWTHNNVLRIGLLLMASSFYFMGVSNRYFLFLTGSIGFGLSMGIIGVVQNIMVSEAAPSDKKQQYLSGLHAMYGMASFISPLLIAILVNLKMSWQNIFFIVGAISIVVVIISYFIKLDKIFKTKSKNTNLKQITKENLLRKYWISFILGGYCIAEIMLSTRIAIFMEKVNGHSLSDSSLYVTYFFVALLSGRLFYTFFKGPGTLRFQLILSLILSIITILIGLSFKPVFLIFTGFFMAPFYPLVMAYMSELFSDHINTAMTIAMSLQGAMIVLMHLSVGYLTDKLGLQVALFVGPLFLILSLILLILFKEEDKLMGNETHQ